MLTELILFESLQIYLYRILSSIKGALTLNDFRQFLLVVAKSTSDAFIMSVISPMHVSL